MYLLLGVTGAALGLGLGLLIGWVLWPVRYVDTDLVDLKPFYQDDYVVMVSYAYAWDSDLEAARYRLAQLSPAAPASLVVEVARRKLEAGATGQDLPYLASLAAALGSRPDFLTPFLSSPSGE